MTIFYILLISFGLQTAMFAQLAPVYMQRGEQSGSQSLFQLWDVEPFDSAGTILGFYQHKGLFTMNMHTNQNAVRTDANHLRGNERAVLRCMDGGIFVGSYFIGLANAFCTLDSGCVQLPAESDGSLAQKEVFAVEDGGIYSMWGNVSIDGGKTYSTSPKQFPVLVDHPRRSMLVKGSVEDVDQRTYLLRRDNVGRLLTGLARISRVEKVCMVENDTLIALSLEVENDTLVQNLYKCKAGVDSIVRIKQLNIQGTLQNILPLTIEQLNDSTFMYVDKSGWYGVVKKNNIVEKRSIAIHGNFLRTLATQSYSYWLFQSPDSTTIYQVFAGNPATVKKTIVRGLLSKLFANPTLKNLGKYGLALRDVGGYRYIVDFTDSLPKVLEIESLVGNVGYNSPRNIFFAQRNGNGTLLVYHSGDNLVATNENMVGHVIAPRLQNNAATTVTGYRNIFLKDSVVMVAGDALRAIQYAAPEATIMPVLSRKTTFVQELDSVRYASANNNVLRIHSKNKLDTILLDIPQVELADSMGSVTSVATSRSGAIFIGVNGIARLRTTTSGEEIEYPLYWGGLLQYSSLADISQGKQPIPVPLGIQGVNSVLGVSQIENTLFAIAAYITEDTSLVEFGNTRSEYTLRDCSLLRSTNNGSSWNIVHSIRYQGRAMPCTWTVVRSSSGSLYAAVAGELLKSTNEGLSWSVDERLPLYSSPINISLRGNTITISATDGVYELQEISSINDESTNNESGTSVVTRAQLVELVEQQENKGRQCVIYNVHGNVCAPAGIGLGTHILQFEGSSRLVYVLP